MQGCARRQRCGSAAAVRRTEHATGRKRSTEDACHTHNGGVTHSRTVAAEHYFARIILATQCMPRQRIACSLKQYSFSAD